jgi:hypothetical protein
MSHLSENELTFVAFMFFKSIPTSRVTPSPKRRLDAATYNGLGGLPRTPTFKKRVRYLKGILLVNPFDWRRESSELIGDSMDVVRCMGSMARAARMLGGVDEPEDGGARRGHGDNYVALG